MKHLVVTTINPPSWSVQQLAVGARRHGWRFVVIGDRKSPPDFRVDGAEFFDLDAQAATGFEFAQAAPTGHYARKNVGYLLAIAAGAESIAETDDDNTPLEDFWAGRDLLQTVVTVEGTEWVNIYAYFSDLTIWPRGLPLSFVRSVVPPEETLRVQRLACPVQQGLADDNPDVDAIYRLILPLPVKFRQRPPIAIANGAWCPFNSQNTHWFPSAYPLLYLPFHCSFRMTDIWRSFVVQAILQANGWGVLFHASTVVQDRNEHDLMRDFSDEVVGYLQNARIRERLLDLPLIGTPESILSDMDACYEELIRLELISSRERELIQAWRNDVERFLPPKDTPAERFGQ